jgi:DNA-binding transcriptional regulator GbsR (MarR family)
MSTPLQPWESDVLDVVGTVIERWGFKFNHGRLWSLLFLRGRPLSAMDLQEALGLSKGAVSIITRELELWSVIQRRRGPSGGLLVYSANTDFIAMIRRVLRDREGPLVREMIERISAAEEDARAATETPPEVLERLRKMRDLAMFAQGSIDTFLTTAQGNFSGLVGTLTGAARRRLSRAQR